jgi:hypothetical protein
MTATPGPDFDDKEKLITACYPPGGTLPKNIHSAKSYFLF